MKKLIILVVLITALAVLGLASAAATTVPPVPLEGRIQGADVIITGTATNISVLDAEGKAVAPEPVATHLETELLIRVEVEELLKGQAEPIPSRIEIQYGRGSILDVANEEERFLGRRYVYLLRRRGERYESAHALQMIEPLSLKEHLLKQ
jgi:hypothetical protein